MRLLTMEQLIKIHKIQIDNFGGLAGIRDKGALESALYAVANRLNYEEGIDEAAIAGTYAYHLCQAHAFHDGNKRVAAMATETFIMLNGYELNIDNELLAVVFLELADGKYSRDDMEEMIRGWLIRETEDSL